MPYDYNLRGGPTPGERLSWYGDDKNLYSTENSIPYGNAMVNGFQGGLVTHLKAWVSGRGAARSVRIGFNGSWTSFFTVGSASQANETSWISYGVVHSPGSNIFYIDPSARGGIYFGRGKDGTGSSALVGTPGGWGGSLSGKFRIIYSPSPPRSVTAVRNDNGTITVSWTAPVADGGEAVGVYYIGRATNSAFTQNAVQTNVSGSLRSYTFTGLAAGATYYFRVSAGNSANTAYGYGSAWSNTSSAQSSAVPSAPGAPVATKVAPTDTTVKLTWTASGDNGSAITSYEIQKSTSADFTTGVVSTTSTTTTTDIPVTLATKYYVRIRAVNSVGTGPWSASTSYPIVPTAPSSVGVVPVNSTTLTASWNTPSNVGGDPITNYELQWSANASFSPGTSSNANNRSRNVSGLTALTLYYFRVRATNGIGTSPWSATASFTTADTEPPPPPPAVTRGGRLKVANKFIEPKVRVRVDYEWVEPISKIRRPGKWVDPV